ncbi:MAG: prepilin-type N-terminal cleavage/methylation domain-containing protein [Candidatus Saccharibacteria bacterium]|nr:prepilin-type N-terminal cleavage/methylation domain-containing protein [Rhodoferax sp.]
MLPNKFGRAARGFTLLEALVTLTLLGLLVAVVFPNMGRWYGGLQIRQAIAQVRGQVQQLAAVAVYTGRDLSLADAMGAQPTVAPRYQIALPTGWALVDAGPLRFLRTGYCTPGVAYFLTPSQRVQVVVQTTMCDLEMSPVLGAP